MNGGALKKIIKNKTCWIAFCTALRAISNRCENGASRRFGRWVAAAVFDEEKKVSDLSSVLK
jgi:hypothetical protein